MPASLTSINEIMLLAGVDHITIAPDLLRELASTEIEGSTTDWPSLFDEVKTSSAQIPPPLAFVENEEGFRMALTRDKQGINEGKLTQVGSCFDFLVHSVGDLQT